MENTKDSKMNSLKRTMWYGLAALVGMMLLSYTTYPQYVGNGVSLLIGFTIGICFAKAILGYWKAKGAEACIVNAVAISAISGAILLIVAILMASNGTDINKIGTFYKLLLYLGCLIVGGLLPDHHLILLPDKE